MSLLVVRLRDIIDRIKDGMSKGEEISQSTIEEIPAIPKDRLVEIVEDAIMRTDELRREKFPVPPELTTYLSTLRTLVKEARDYGSIEREASLACVLALAILELSDRRIDLSPYLERLREVVLEVVDRAFR